MHNTNTTRKTNMPSKLGKASRASLEKGLTLASNSKTNQREDCSKKRASRSFFEL